MNTLSDKNELDILCCLQNIRHNLIAKDIILRSIKQRQTSIDFINQLDMPEGLKELIINHGFTLDLLLNIQPTDLAEVLGIDKDVANIISDVTKKHMKASAFDTNVTDSA